MRLIHRAGLATAVLQAPYPKKRNMFLFCLMLRALTLAASSVQST